MKNYERCAKCKEPFTAEAAKRWREMFEGVDENVGGLCSKCSWPYAPAHKRNLWTRSRFLFGAGRVLALVMHTQP